MTTDDKATQAPSALSEQTSILALSSTVEDDGKDWNSLELVPCTAAHLWEVPAGADLSMREQALITARRAKGLHSHRTAPLFRKLSARDFAGVVGEGHHAISEYNRGQLEAGEELEEHDLDRGFDIHLESPIMARRLGESGDMKITSVLTIRPLCGGDVWDVPSSGLALGNLGMIGARATGYADAYVKRLSPADFGRLVGVVNAFLSPFRPTGETL